MSEEVEDFLAHYGVKGMKWGVRKADDSSGYSKGEYVKALGKRTKQTPKEVEKALIESFDKSYSKLDPSTEEPRKGLTPTQKKALIAGGIAALAIAGGVVAYKAGAFDDIQVNLINRKHGLDVKGLTRPNPPFTAETGQGWYGREYLRPSSFDRPEITLPRGHEFFRLSTYPESTFNLNDGTYMTSSQDDFLRYVRNFRGELGGKKLHKIAFAAEKEMRFPDTTTTLNALREVMETREKKFVTSEDVMYNYNKFSGGKWSDSDPVVSAFKKALISKGYAGIIDEMDAGVMGELPMVLFDTGVVGVKSSAKMATSDLDFLAAFAKPLDKVKEFMDREEFDVLSDMVKSKAVQHMKYSDTTTEAYEFLAHYGVKGMQWGKRKTETPQAEGYSRGQRTYDSQAYGRKHSKMVNQGMLDGKDIKTSRADAHKVTQKRNKKIATTVIGAYVVAQFAPIILASVAPSLNRGLYNLDKKAGDVAFNAFAKDGMKKAATILADSRGLTSYETIAGEFLK